MPSLRTLVLILALTLPTGRALGSDGAPPSTLSVGANVLGLATLNPTLDLEARLLPTLSLGLTAWWEVRAVEDRWAQARVAWYPMGTAMQGPSVAVTGGVHRAYRSDDAPPTARERATSPTAGVLVGYDFRFARAPSLRVGIVTGAKVTFGESDGDSPLDPYYIEGRLNLGLVF